MTSRYYARQRKLLTEGNGHSLVGPLGPSARLRGTEGARSVAVDAWVFWARPLERSFPAELTRNDLSSGHSRGVDPENDL